MAYGEAVNDDTVNGEIVMNGKMQRLNADGELRTDTLCTRANEGRMIIEYSYGDEEMGYIYQKTIEGEETSKTRKEISLNGRFGVSSVPMYDGIANMVYMTPLMVRVEDTEWYTVESVAYYLDETDDQYTKVKVVEKLQYEEGGTTEETYVWVYEKDGTFVAGLAEGIVENVKDAGTPINARTKISVEPWEGTITPPDHLDSYISEE